MARPNIAKPIPRVEIALIAVHADATGLWVVRQGVEGEVNHPILYLNPAVTQELRKRIATGLGDWEDSPRPRPSVLEPLERAIGQNLSGIIGSDFEQRLEGIIRSLTGDDILVLSIELTGESFLHELPLEMLALSSSKNNVEPLANVVVGRHTTGPYRRRTQKGPWRVLCWKPDPDDEIVEQAYEGLKSACRRSRIPLLTFTEIARIPPPKEGCRDVLHVIAHGESSPEGTFVVLRRADSLTGHETVGATSIAEMVFPHIDRLQGIALQACGAAAMEGGIVSTLTQTMLEAGIPWCLAPVRMVSPESAAAFTDGFYRTLQATSSLAHAMRAGRCSVTDALHTISGYIHRRYNFALYYANTDVFRIVPVPHRSRWVWRAMVAFVLIGIATGGLEWYSHKADDKGVQVGEETDTEDAADTEAIADTESNASKVTVGTPPPPPPAKPRPGTLILDAIPPGYTVEVAGQAKVIGRGGVVFRDLPPREYVIAFTYKDHETMEFKTRTIRRTLEPGANLKICWDLDHDRPCPDLPTGVP